MGMRRTPSAIQLETLMKILIIAAGLAALMPAAAQAQDQEVREERRVVVLGEPGHRMEIGDEGLTREAFAAHHAEMFASMDADSNGVVTRDEMRAFHERLMPEIAELRGPHGPDGPGNIVIRRHGGGHEDGDVVVFRHRLGDGEGVELEDGQVRVFEFRHDGEGHGLDADSDGRLTFEEMVAPMRRHFDEMDANDDGFVDDSERGPGLRWRSAED